MNTPTSYILPLCLLLFLPCLAVAQGEVFFEARANAKQVILGNHFEVSFVLGNARGKDFKPPVFKGFKKLSGQNVRSQTSNINGEWEMTKSYSYFLEPQNTGRLTIGSASINVGGKFYKTKPLTIEVLKGNASKKPADDEEDQIFIRAELSDSSAVAGQQVTLDYKVYTAVGVEHFSIVDEPDYAGFFTSVIRRYSAARSTKVINGVQYATQIIKRVALYPQQTGTAHIEPIKVQVAVPITQPSGWNGNSRNPFRHIRPTQRHIITSNELELQVNPLPRPIPASFSGAVGHYRASALLDRTTATTDDAITLRITVMGDGDIQRVTAPEFKLSKAFEVYDPNVVDERQNERNGELYGSKTFEYLILPKAPGQYTVAPEFSYFSPDSSKFVTLKPNAYQVSITKGVHNNNVNVKPPEIRKEQLEIRDILTDWRVRSKREFFGSGLFFGALALPLLALLGGMAYRYVQANRPEVDRVAERSNKAQKVAKQRLAVAEKHLMAGDTKAFYNETSKVLLGYAADKFNISGSELSKDNVEGKLRESGVGEEHIQRFVSLLKTCEQAVYGLGSGNAERVYQDAVGVIVDIER